MYELILLIVPGLMKTITRGGPTQTIPIRLKHYLLTDIL